MMSGKLVQTDKKGIYINILAYSRITGTPEVSVGCDVTFAPASELIFRPAPAPAANDWRAPREAMGLTEELLLEVGEEPAGQSGREERMEGVGWE